MLAGLEQTGRLAWNVDAGSILRTSLANSSNQQRMAR
jgi:hypothetical protein